MVYEGDEFDYQEGEDPHLIHRPVPPAKRVKEGDDYAWIGAYSRCRLPDGMTDVLWMWREEIEELRRKSSKAGSGPWDTWFWEMVKKTPIKRHMKYLRLSEDAGRAVGVDDQAEAFAAKDRETQPKRDEVAQDLILEASFIDQAMDADEKLARGTHDEQKAEAARKLAGNGKRITQDRGNAIMRLYDQAEIDDPGLGKLLAAHGVNRVFDLNEQGADAVEAELRRLIPGKEAAQG